MKHTFLETAKNGALVFVGVSDYNHRLKVHASRTKTSNNGVPAELIRASLYLTEPQKVLGEDCGAGCTPSGVFTRSTRVELSNVDTVDHNVIIQDLRDIADFIEANPRLLNGLNLQQAADVDFPLPRVGG